MNTTVEPLLTAEAFARLPQRGVPLELVRGRVVEMNLPAPRHGQIAAKVARLLGNHVEERSLGHVIVGDSGIRTERGPDTVRGADVAFWSFAKVPPGPFPPGYLDEVPELVFEVRSPTDRWPQILAKVSEYLEAGVQVVCVLDQVSETVQIYWEDTIPQTLHETDVFRLPELLGEFAVEVGRFFE